MKTSDYTIYSIIVVLFWIVLRAVIIALILYFSWSAIIPNVFPTETIIKFSLKEVVFLLNPLKQLLFLI